MNYKISLTIGALLLSAPASVLAATTSCTLPQKLFQVGMKDGKEKNITILQTMLASEGYLKQSPNGTFDAATKQAVIAL